MRAVKPRGFDPKSPNKAAATTLEGGGSRSGEPQPAVAGQDHTRDETVSTLLLDFVYGSLWYRLVFQVGPLGCGWADETAAAIAAMG
jgi:hypothetical protein